MNEEHKTLKIIGLIFTGISIVVGIIALGFHMYNSNLRTQNDLFCYCGTVSAGCYPVRIDCEEEERKFSKFSKIIRSCSLLERGKSKKDYMDDCADKWR